LGTFGDKKCAFKSVILRDAVSATENSDTHYRLYLQPDYARPRTKTKRALLASNPTPSANIYNGFMSFPKIKNSELVFITRQTPDKNSFLFKFPSQSGRLEDLQSQLGGLNRGEQP